MVLEIWKTVKLGLQLLSENTERKWEAQNRLGLAGGNPKQFDTLASQPFPLCLGSSL